MTDIVQYLENFERDNNLTLKPLEGYKLEIKPSPGAAIDSKIESYLKSDKDFYIRAVKIRRSRNELQELQSNKEVSKHQFEIRDRLRIAIFNDVDCIWNHTEFKTCIPNLTQCHICKLGAKVEMGQQQ